MRNSRSWLDLLTKLAWDVTVDWRATFAFEGHLLSWWTQSCHHFQTNRNFFRFYDARLKYVKYKVCNRTPPGSEATKVDQLKNCRAKTIVKGGRQGRQSNAFCISCFSLLFLLHFNSFSFTWELLFWIVNCPSRESRSEINLVNLNSVRSVVDTREREIDEWSQKSQLKLNAECIAAQYSKFSRLWFSHFSSLSSSVDCSST